MDILGKRIENPSSVFELSIRGDQVNIGVLWRYVRRYSGGMYNRGARVRYDRGACADVRVTYRRLLMVERVGRALNE